MKRAEAFDAPKIETHITEPQPQETLEKTTPVQEEKEQTKTTPAPAAETVKRNKTPTAGSGLRPAL